MKRNLVQYLISILFALIFSTSAFAETTYTMDPSHSYVLWRISHFGFSDQVGKWYIEKGTISLDKNNPQNSQVNAVIDMNSIATGLPELDKHLKSPLFFDVANFPTATFVSNKIKVTAKNKALIYGTLTMHGVTKPIILNATLNKSGVNPINNKNTVGFSATTTIDRSDYGVTTLSPGLGEKVDVMIDVEANQ